MTDEQLEHVHKISRQSNNRLMFKYSKGAKEHGGNIWEYSASWLLDQAIDEAIDQLTYLYTLKEILETNRYADNNLQD